MLLLCCGLASSYYAFDIPSATETALQSAFLGSGSGGDVCVNGTNVPAGDSAAADAFNNNFNLLYSVYAWCVRGGGAGRQFVGGAAAVVGGSVAC